MYARSHKRPQALQPDPGYGEYVKSHYPSRHGNKDSLPCKECGVGARPATTPPEVNRQHGTMPPPSRHHSRSVVQPILPIKPEQRRTRRTPEPVADTRGCLDPLRSHPVKAHERAQPAQLQAPQPQRVVRPFVRSQTLPPPCNVVYNDNYDSTETFLWTPARQAEISAAIIPPTNKLMSYRSRERLNGHHSNSNGVSSRRDTPVSSISPLSFADHRTHSANPSHHELFLNDHLLKDHRPRAAYDREQYFSNGPVYKPPTPLTALNRAVTPQVDTRITPASPEFARHDAQTDYIDGQIPVRKIPPFEPLNLYLPAGSSLHDQVFGQVGDEDEMDDIYYDFNRQQAFRKSVTGWRNQEKDQ
jgi:hypothetical protein